MAVQTGLPPVVADAWTQTWTTLEPQSPLPLAMVDPRVSPPFKLLNSYPYEDEDEDEQRIEKMEMEDLIIE